MCRYLLSVFIVFYLHLASVKNKRQYHRNAFFIVSHTRYIELSVNFGCNNVAFQLGTAFVLYSIIKGVLKLHGQDFSGTNT